MVKSSQSLNSIREKVTYTHELISTTHHEAGHTIYALLHYMMVHSVRVFQDKDSERVDGFTYYNSLSLETIEDPVVLAERVQVEIGLSYAGLIAEKYQYKLHSGSDKFPSFLDGSSKDLSEASQLIKKYQVAPAGRKRYVYKKQIVRQVTNELQTYWEDIVLVAHTLFRKKRLSFADLKNLLTKKSSSKDFWKERLKIVESYYQTTDLDEQVFRSILSL